MKTMFRLVSFLVVIFAISIATAAFWLKKEAEKPLAMRESVIQVNIAKGSGVRAIAALLNRQGVQINPWILEAHARWRGDQSKLKSGLYEFKSPLTVNQLLDKLAEGETIQYSVRLIEGWTFKQFRAALGTNTGLKQTTTQMSVEELLRAIGTAETHPEGLFFPDTYKFSPGQSDLDVLKRAYREQQSRLQKVWEARPSDTPLKSPYEALILASIIEKETGLEVDRDKVSAVFNNRLKIGMRLQTDPTVIYGMGDDFKGNIRKRDLETDTPYNTYTRNGLPPTPIAMPGQNSLNAVFKPANIRALYFVARGDGTSEFSDDLGAHNRAVDRFQRRRLQPSDQKP